MIPSIERRGRLSPTLAAGSRAIGSPARAVPRTPAVAVVNARVMPVERNHKE